MDVTPILIVKVHNTRLIAFAELAGYVRLRKPSDASLLNLRKEKLTGEMSTKASANLRSIIQLWINCIDAAMIVKFGDQKRYDQYVTFVTLTLSSLQRHDDRWIRRNMLNEFLITVKRHHHVCNYVCVSEAQGNGNIHFHILIDRQINWRDIRSIWNAIQEKTGYIQPFCEKFGHRDPNSTDIHALKKVNYVANYLTKYFTKKSNRRKLTGRLWSSSENLKLIQPLRICGDQVIDAELCSLAAINEKRSYDHQYFSVLNFGNIRNIRDIAPRLHLLFITHYVAEFQKLNNTPSS